MSQLFSLHPAKAVRLRFVTVAGPEGNHLEAQAFDATRQEPRIVASAPLKDMAAWLQWEGYAYLPASNAVYVR